MGLTRRLPLYTRPLPFLAGAALLVLGLMYGPNWIWTSNLFSGNILIQTLIPTQLFVFTSFARVFWLAAAVAGVVVLGFFTFTRWLPSKLEGLNAPRWRFYPLTFLFGLFLGFFGLVYFFDLTFAFDDTPGGFVMYSSLNYSGLTTRFVLGTVGGLLLLGSFFLIFGASLHFDTGRFIAEREAIARPAPNRPAEAAPDPAPAAPRLQVVEPEPVAVPAKPRAARSKTAAKAAVVRRKPARAAVSD
jgi:hypothetical protein